MAQLIFSELIPCLRHHFKCSLVGYQEVMAYYFLFFLKYKVMAYYNLSDLTLRMHVAFCPKFSSTIYSMIIQDIESWFLFSIKRNEVGCKSINLKITSSGSSLLSWDSYSSIFLSAGRTLLFTE